MAIEKIIDLNLSLIKQEGNMFFMRLVNEKSEEFNDILKCNEVKQELLNNNLITEYGEIISLSPFGINIVNNGGWIAHIKNGKINQAITERKQIASSKKEETKLDLEIKALISAEKRQKKTNIITYATFILSLSLALNEFGFFTFLKNIFK